MNNFTSKQGLFIGRKVQSALAITRCSKVIFWLGKSLLGLLLLIGYGQVMAQYVHPNQAGRKGGRFGDQ